MDDSIFTREDLVTAIKNNMKDLNSDRKAEFVARLLEYTNDYLSIKNAINNCEIIRFELI